MANQGSENAGQKPHTPDEIDASFEHFEKAERARKRKVLLLALVLVGAGLAVFFGSVIFRDNRMEGVVDVEALDAEAAAKINDPQCRDLIAQVDQLSARYFKLEGKLEDDLLGDDPQKIKALRDEIARIQQRIDEIAEFSLSANLRYEASRAELDAWFEYVALEFTFVDRLGRERLAALAKEADATDTDAADTDADAGASAEASPDTSQPDAGEQGVVVAGERKKREAKKEEAPTKSPLERKQAALVALHDSFQNFRIWHTASAHPCGAADEDETPWEPTETDSP